MKKSKKEKIVSSQESLKTNFPAILKAACEAFTVKKVAAECGVTVRSVQLWMAGERNANYVTMVGCREVINGIKA